MLFELPQVFSKRVLINFLESKSDNKEKILSYRSYKEKSSKGTTSLFGFNRVNKLSTMEFWGYSNNYYSCRHCPCFFRTKKTRQK